MSIIAHLPTSEQLESKVDCFFREHRVGGLLKRCNFGKETGFSCLCLLKFVFLLAFTGKNLFQLLQTETAVGQHPGKDSVYRFLNNCRFNWRRLLLLLAGGIVKERLQPLTAAERVKVLIVDDSLFSRGRSKTVELLARVFDHATHRYVRGFRMLTVGWSDGNTFMPLCFSLLSSEKADNRLQDANDKIDKRTVGYRRRREAVRKAPDVLLELIRQALEVGVEATHVLFDSWFAFPGTIQKICEQGLHVICMLKALPTVKYDFNGQVLTLKQLYAAVRKRPGRARILASLTVTLVNDAQGLPVKAKIVFVRDRRNSGKWLALLSTDLTLSDEEVVRIYGKRWDIEVFFKMTKSYLNLAKEFQGRSYDMMVAHTSIVFMRYVMLALLSREEADPRTLGNLFYACCDELQDLSFTSALAMLLDLLKRAIKSFLFLTDEIADKLFALFTQGLPPIYRRSLGILPCES